MKTNSRPKTDRGFTLIDFFMVIVCVMMLAVLLLPLPSVPNEKARGVMCLSNLRMNTTGLFLWGEKHHDELPWRVPTGDGGTMDFVEVGVSPHFSAISNFVPIPRSFRCPADKARQPATNYAGLSDQNISYFIDLDVVRIGATNASRSVLAGDRNLEVNGKPINPGPLMVSPGTDLAWTREFHRIGGKTGGNLVFMDGHAARTSDLQLRDAVQSQGGTNRFLFP